MLPVGLGTGAGAPSPVMIAGGRRARPRARARRWRPMWRSGPGTRNTAASGGRGVTLVLGLVALDFTPPALLQFLQLSKSALQPLDDSLKLEDLKCKMQ